MQKVVIFISLVACLGLKLDVRTSDDPPECKGKLVEGTTMCSDVDPETKKKCDRSFVDVGAGLYMQCVWDDESDQCLTGSGINDPYCTKPVGPQPPKDGMFAWFRSEDASTSWVSKVGNFEGKGTGSDLKIETAKGHGAKEKVKFLKGTKSDKFDFGAILPKNKYTVCSISRYAGAQRKRIIQMGTHRNWLHGHWGGNTGVCHYNQWNTAHSRYGNKEDWVVLCGTNNKQVYDGRDGSTNIATANGQGFDKDERLYVNDGHNEFSDFAVMEIITYKKQLSKEKIQEVMAYLKWKLENGTP